MTELELKIYEIVRQIPAGTTLTYGQVAELAGNKKLARVVGNAMHKNPLPFLELARQTGYTGDFQINYQNLPENFEPVPCHRVVNASGKMGSNFGLGGPEIQSRMLQAEKESIKLENHK